MIDPIDDGDLAQARRRVQVLEAQHKGLKAQLAEADAIADHAIELLRKSVAARDFALRLRDASALEHERERTRRQEVEQVLGRVREFAESAVHSEDCDRYINCDDDEGCPDHGAGGCPPCECGKDELLAILAARSGHKEGQT